jgi:hypothetical protein
MSGQTRFRVKPGVPLVRIKNPEGRYEDFYGETKVLPRWASTDEDQVRHLLDLSLIECCDDAGQPTDPGRVVECLSVLISVGVPEDAGRPRAADMLRRENFRYSNETISAAIKLRKSGWKFGEPIEEYLR